MATTNSYRSRFSPESHFFTDPSVMTQSEAQIFGPIDDREFRLTTKFNAPGAKAFAICKGIVLIQPQAGSVDKVNLILRPYTQPITGFNIKYFIYRGLDKSNFFSTDQVIEKSETSSDLINRVNKDFISFHQKGNDAIPPFLAKYLGYDPLVQEDALMIDSFFFKETQLVEENGSSSEVEETAFELPLVDIGDSLGNFSDAESGIDIILNYGDYQLPLPNEEFVFDLAYARAKEAVISLPQELSDFQKKVKRERIFQFLDAAAFFGFHSDGGKVKVDQNGTKVTKTAEAIYNEVILNFKTKNRLYLYIQSDRTRSYNFYGNYAITEGSANSIKIGNSASGLVESVYGIQGWPVIIDEAVQTHEESRNKLFLQLVTDNNVNTMLYGQVAEIDNAQHNNFCNADDLRLPYSDEGIPSSLTKIIELSNPAAGPDGGKVNVASFNILLYHGITYRFVLGQIPDRITGEVKDMISPVGSMDDIFDVITPEVLLKTKGNSGYSATCLQRVKMVNYYRNNTQVGIHAIQSLVIHDEIKSGSVDQQVVKRVSYLTEAVDVFNNSTGVLGTISGESKLSSTLPAPLTGESTYVLPEPFYFINVPFFDDVVPINGIQLETTEQSVPVKKIIGLTAEEHQMLTGVSDSSLTNAKLMLFNASITSEDLISTNGVKYQKYNVGVLKEDSSGKVVFSLPSDEIILYSLDQNYYCSKAYSEYMTSDFGAVKGDIDNNDLKID